MERAQDNHYGDLDRTRGTCNSAFYEAIDKDGVGGRGKVTLKNGQYKLQNINQSPNEEEKIERAQDNHYGDLDRTRGTCNSALYEALDKDEEGGPQRVTLISGQRQIQSMDQSQNDSHSDSIFTRNHLIIGAVVQCFVVIVLVTVGSFVAYNMAKPDDTLYGTRSGGLQKDRIFFRAAYLTDITLRRNQTLVFERVLANLGSGYDPQTGRFTAPTAGLYIFSAQICVHSRNYFNFAFYVDGLSIQEITIYDKSNVTRTCDTHTVICQLNKGWEVEIRATGRVAMLLQSRALFNIFSGVLLNP